MSTSSPAQTQESTLALIPKPEPAAEPIPEAQLPATRKTGPIIYETFDGQQIEMTVKLFQMTLCPAADPAAAYYMLSWCSHNRIDPFANEAHFSIMQDKPVIQVSKDAWYKRMERHPQFEWIKDGIRVETTPQHVLNSLWGEDSEYQITAEFRAQLLRDFRDGKNEKAWLDSKITLKKVGTFVSPGEKLLAGWSLIKRKDRPILYPFDTPLEGWKGTTKSGEDNIFWSRKAPFMINKSARKNCARAAFPELSGLITTPEVRDDDDGDYVPHEPKQPNRGALIRALHMAGSSVAPPLGPLDHEDLHALSVANYNAGLTELNTHQLGSLCSVVTAASAGDIEIINMIERQLALYENANGDAPDAAGRPSITIDSPVEEATRSGT